MIDGFISLASLNRFEINFSLSPKYFESKSLDLMEKNVPYASEAQALAIHDLPVPGGPKSIMPVQGFLSPSKSYGNLVGRITASFSASFAASNPATSSQVTFKSSRLIIASFN